MKKINIVKIYNLIASLFLGIILFLGGLKKFEKPIPKPSEMIENVKSGSLDNIDEPTLVLKNYVFGMKQTDFFWQFLGIAEIIFSILVMSQVFRFVGSVLLLPITVNIFLFHLFLEPNEVGELIQTTALFAVNLWLIIYEFPKWRNLLFNKSNLNLLS
uniref:DoxX protein n=1 Tax=Flavobacterium sp. TaxID=239 RepID=UPI00404A1846